MGQRSLLSCRRWKAANHGVDVLRALQAACEREGARGVYLGSLDPASLQKGADIYRKVGLLQHELKINQHVSGELLPGR